MIESNDCPLAEAEEIQKRGSTVLPRKDQSKIDPLLSDSYKEWALAPICDDGSVPLLICDMSGVLNLFNRLLNLLYVNFEFLVFPATSKIKASLIAQHRQESDC